MNGLSFRPKPDDIVRVYLSLADYIRRAELPDRPGSRFGRHENWPNFTGCQSYEEAFALARNGWPQGTEQMKSISGRLLMASARKQGRRVVESGPAGFAPIIPKAVAGVPDSMLRHIELDKPKSVHITVNGFITGGMHKDTIMRRGAAILSLYKALKAHRFAVEIDIVIPSSNHHSSGHYIEVIKLVRSHQFFDLTKLAYALGHPSMFRALAFRACEQEPEDIRQKFGFYAGSFYGTTEEVVPLPGTVYLAALYGESGYFDTDRNAHDWLIKKLAAFGIVGEFQDQK